MIRKRTYNTTEVNLLVAEMVIGKRCLSFQSQFVSWTVVDMTQCSHLQSHLQYNKCGVFMDPIH